MLGRHWFQSSLSGGSGSLRSPSFFHAFFHSAASWSIFRINPFLPSMYRRLDPAYCATSSSFRAEYRAAHPGCATRKSRKAR